MPLLPPSKTLRGAGRLPVALMACAVMGVALRAAPAPMVVVPRYTHPGAGQTFYFVLPDRFANGSTANDTGNIPGGPDDHGFDPTRITHYHGGDFAGLTARLDYIKNLGTTAIWVTPPFRNQPVRDKPGIGRMAGYHGYWIMDFLHVDPHLGTEAEFREFVRQAQVRGIRVYLDIVVNHTADVIGYGGAPSTATFARRPTATPPAGPLTSVRPPTMASTIGPPFRRCPSDAVFPCTPSCRPARSTPRIRTG